MYYVYIIKSIPFPKQYYVGFSENHERRLEYHNAGKSIHTNKFRPWESVCYFAFVEEKTAREFEMYLKSGSGRAFLKKHFFNH